MLGVINGTGACRVVGLGTNSLIVLAVVVVGAMLLAVLFAQLTRRMPIPTTTF